MWIKFSKYRQKADCKGGGNSGVGLNTTDDCQAFGVRSWRTTNAFKRRGHALFYSGSKILY